MSDLSRVTDRTAECGLGESQTGKPVSAPKSLFALLLGLVVLIMGAVTFNNYHYTSAIQRHGNTQEAQVVDFYRHVYNGRLISSCSIYGDLLFTPSEWSRTVKIRMLLSGCRQNSRALSYAIQNHTLPIAYEVSDPRNTIINFDNQVFLQDTGAQLKVDVLITICVSVICVFTFILI